MNAILATRLEWSSFCETQWNKKAGTEGGEVAQTKEAVSILRRFFL
jgi:hypothetical protein